jgi:hypothetical protein
VAAVVVVCLQGVGAIFIVLSLDGRERAVELGRRGPVGPVYFVSPNNVIINRLQL